MDGYVGELWTLVYIIIVHSTITNVHSTGPIYKSRVCPHTFPECSGISLIWPYFYTFLPCNKQFAAKFSYQCNSHIFQHYVKYDTTRKNCRKWREKCTGGNHNLASFNGSQMHLIFYRIQ